MVQQKLKMSLFLLSLFIFGTVIAQQDFNSNEQKSNKGILFSDDFSDFEMNDWTKSGENIENWSVIPTDRCGGELPEAILFGTPVFSGSSRLISPVINTQNNAELELSLLHYYNIKDGGYSLSIETTCDGGNSWNQVWEKYINEGANSFSEAIEINISNTDVGSPSFQFAFVFNDDSSLMSGWSFDNLILKSTQNIKDVTPVIIQGIEEVKANDELIITSFIENLGEETVSFDVKLEISDGSNVLFENTKSITNLAGENQAQLEFDSWTAVEGLNYSATVKTLLADDENQNNNHITSMFNVYPENWYCIPSGVCEYGDGISDFAFAGIENFENGCSLNGYGFFTDLTAEVTAGENYQVSLATNWDSQHASIWIDFNQDMEFSQNELILSDFELNDTDGMVNVNVSIPADVSAANTYMRVGVTSIENSSTDVCTDFFYGEWEDYRINISGITGAGEIDLTSNQIQLFPNPAKDFINIQSSEVIESVQIYNHTGQLLREFHSATDFNQIQLNSFISGMYLLQIKTANAVYTEKILIH